MPVGGGPFDLRTALMNLIRSAADPAGELRYGVPTSEKERLAITRALPGAPAVGADDAPAQRYASGYLSAKANPDLTAALLPLISQLKVSDVPLLGGSSPELQSQAEAGANQAYIQEGPAELARRRALAEQQAVAPTALRGGTGRY